MSNSDITIKGNVGKDPELRFSNAGKPICNFSVAVTHKRGDDEQTSWVDVVCFDQMAENAAESIRKGQRVVVAGRLQVRDYERRDGGQGRSVEVVADEVAVSLRWATATVEKAARKDVQADYKSAGTRQYDNVEPF